MQNNLEKLSATKIFEHILFGYLMSTIWRYDGLENKHNVCRGEVCKKTFSESLTLKRREEKLEDKYTTDKNYHIGRDYFYFTDNYTQVQSYKI